MSTQSRQLPWKWIRLAIAATVLIVAAVTWPRWSAPLRQWVQATTGGLRAAPTGEHAHAHPGEDHAAHDDHSGHDHAGHSEENSIELSPQAMRNLGLTREFLQPVELSTFRRSIRVPAVFVEQPGRTRIQVATPMTAIVTRMHVVSGEAIQPGQLLFSLRLTHEDLVSAQTEFLKALGERDVEQQELERLQKITTGAIPPNLILERKYAVQKLDARISADREALKLHGLNEEQIRSIEADRRLLRTLEVYAPAPGDRSDSEYRLTDTPVHPVSFSKRAPEDGGPTTPEPGAAGENDGTVLIVETLEVHQGQAVMAGEALCVLADYSRLYIEGQAFERDARAIIAAREHGWPLTAYLEGSIDDERIEGLSIAFVANEIDVQSRTLHFYVEVPNTLLPPPPDAPDSRFVTWKYRPGQRLELQVPIEEWADQIVLPVGAVAHEVAESYVFLQNGKHFDRKPVHVKYRDQTSVVIANDGAIFPGDVVALRGAHQLQMALKNKSGGGVDPHAGHHH